jgi:sigma-E factor negative regulatory protein RseC
MSRMLPGKEHYVRALIDEAQHKQLAIGDTVEIDVPDDVILQASVMVYLVPLLMLIVGMFLGSWLSPGDPGAIFGGLLGLLAGAGIVRWHAAHVRNDGRIQPRVVDSINEKLVVRS